MRLGPTSWTSSSRTFAQEVLLSKLDEIRSTYTARLCELPGDSVIPILELWTTVLLLSVTPALRAISIRKSSN